MAAPNPPQGSPKLKVTSAERPNTLGLSQRDLVTLLNSLDNAQEAAIPVLSRPIIVSLKPPEDDLSPFQVLT